MEMKNKIDILMFDELKTVLGKKFYFDECENVDDDYVNNKNMKCLYEELNKFSKEELIDRIKSTHWLMKQIIYSDVPISKKKLEFIYKKLYF